MKKQLLWSLTILGGLLPAVPARTQTIPPHGTIEFLHAGTYTWVAPMQKSALAGELWGAGGGGTQRIVPNARSGNGGGSGALVRAVLRVTPGQTYNVIVGAGGLGDSGSGSGANGGSTQITDSLGTLLISAGGGTGGSKTPDTGGAGGVPDPAAGIKRTGHTGGTSTGIEGGNGGVAVQGTIELPYSMDGGDGASYRSTGPGGEGGDGYAVLSW